MRLLLVLLFIPALAFAAEGDGRYQLLNSSDEVFMLDTRTGKIWSYLKSTNPIWLPNVFMCKDDTASVSPTCENAKTLPTIPTSK